MTGMARSRVPPPMAAEGAMRSAPTRPPMMSMSRGMGVPPPGIGGPPPMGAPMMGSAMRGAPIMKSAAKMKSSYDSADYLSESKDEM